MTKLLCLDPGTLNTGWAVHTVGEGEIQAGCWVRPKDVGADKAHEYIWGCAIEKMLATSPAEVWIEMYYPFGGRSRRNTHAQILLVGGLLALAQCLGAKVVSVTPKEWKEWAKPLKSIVTNPHADDAIKIGLYAQYLKELESGPTGAA